MLLRIVVAIGCFAAAVLAVVQPEVDIRQLDALSAQHPESTIALLTRAHRIHPRDTSVSLQLGLELERTDDLAESILLEAARFDHQYQPAWSLANFYFRRQDRGHFWTWAARAARINNNDFRPLLRLAAVWAPEPRELVARLGDRPELLRSYLDILIGENRLPAAAEVAGFLREHNDPADLPRLRNFPSGSPR
jgi:hypothetical protein